MAKISRDIGTDYLIYMTRKRTDSGNAGVTTSKITFCDLRCPHADFARTDALDGSCRTFMSIWCRQLSTHVAKNAPCEARFGKRRPTTGF